MVTPEGKPQLISIGAAAKMLGISVAYVRKLSNDGTLTPHVSSGGHRRFDPATLRAEWAQFRAETPGRPEWSETYELDGLDEAEVWAELRENLDIVVPAPARGILAYAVTEMVNNAIDHSGGTEVTVSATVTGRNIQVRIADDGIGAFRNMSEGLGLGGPSEALVEVTKGKRTTQPDRHAGEGLFFTLRAADVASLSSNGYIVVADASQGADRFAAGSSRNAGTVVTVRLNLDTGRQLADVFGQFAPLDDEGMGGFVATAPRISLVSYSGEFVSRSEAKRFAEGLERFETVVLDFAGLDLIGQGFADELFRVWQRAHPEVELQVTGASRGVKLMIDRALRNV